jgi:hypothetical protein
MSYRELVIRTALEWWEALGKYSLADLRALIEQGAHTYAIPATEHEAMTQEAWARIPAWKIATRVKVC